MREENAQAIFQFPFPASTYVLQFLGDMRQIGLLYLAVAQQPGVMLGPRVEIGFVLGVHGIVTKEDIGARE